MPIYALGDLVPIIAPTAYVHPDAVLIGAVTIGPEASVWAGAVVRADMGQVSVGARTSIQDNTVLHTTREWPTVIGAECVVGHVAHLEGCTVEDRCLIGSGSVVLNRARIGAGSVIGAQALVVENMVVPPQSLMLGVPARPRPLDPAEQAAWIDFGVREYVDNARLFRDQLRLVEPDRLRKKL